MVHQYSSLYGPQIDSGTVPIHFERAFTFLPVFLLLGHRYAGSMLSCAGVPSSSRHLRAHERKAGSAFQLERKEEGHHTDAIFAEIYTYIISPSIYIYIDTYIIIHIHFFFQSSLNIASLNWRKLNSIRC